MRIYEIQILMLRGKQVGKHFGAGAAGAEAEAEAEGVQMPHFASQLKLLLHKRRITEINIDVKYREIFYIGDDSEYRQQNIIYCYYFNFSHKSGNMGKYTFTEDFVGVVKSISNTIVKYTLHYTTNHTPPHCATPCTTHAYSPHARRHTATQEIYCRGSLAASNN